jgi:serine/threonine protein kinase
MDINKLCVGCMDNDTGDEICPKCGAPFDMLPKNSLQLKPRTILREQYLIGRALGHGGFGITYLAWDIGLATKLAVKEYMPNGVAGRASGATHVLAYSEATKQEFEWGLERFLEEARTLKRFGQYPGIVSVDTIFRENGTAYLVMEYLDGWTFEDFLKKRGGSVGVETALRILLPVIDALGPVHAEGILHRDISPDNIYLTRSGKVKLIDFGAARNALGQKSRNLSIILKEGYAPEEQYRASGIQGPWTDVYATGATLYHAITGHIPRPALDRLADDRLERPSAMGIEIDPQIEAALMKSLAVRASDRFQSMEDFRAALTGEVPVTPLPPQSAIRPSAFQAPPPPPAPISAVPPVPAPLPAVASGRPRWILPAGLGAAALAAVMIVVSRQPIPGPTGASGATGASNSIPSGSSGTYASGSSGSPTGATGAPTGPTGVPTGPTGEPTGATGAPTGPTGRRHEPTGATGARPTGAGGDRSVPTGATGGNYEPTGATGSPYVPTGPTGSPYYPPQPTGATGAPPPTPPSGDYDSLMEQAKTSWDQRRYPQVMQILMQAIRLDPSRPRAYSGLGELQLYVLGDLGGAMQNYRTAYARNGEACFHVLHDHSAETFVKHCSGFLYVSRKGVRFVASDSNHGFNVSRGEIREARQNTLRLSFRPQVIDMHSFHIKLATGQSYNFAPTSRFQQEERNLALGMIQ